MQSAPGVVMTLEQSATRYTNETEMQAEELIQSLTVVLDDGYGAKVGEKASRALLVKTLAVQREHERTVYRQHRAAYPGTSFTATTARARKALPWEASTVDKPKGTPT